MIFTRPEIMPSDTDTMKQIFEMTSINLREWVAQFDLGKLKVMKQTL